MRDSNRTKSNRSSLVWMIGFLSLLGFFYWLDQSPFFQEVVVARLARWTARGTASILTLLGLDVNLSGTTVTGSGLRLEIAKSCSGSFVFLMYAAAVIPFPVPWKSRLKGLLMGLLTLLAVNLLRTSLIVLVVSRFPGSLWTFHIIVGQALVIVALMGVFLWWAKNTHGETAPSFFRNNRTIFRFLLLFGFGYVAGYGLYQVFLESPLGLFVNHLIQIHLEWLLTAIHTHILSRQHASFSPVNVRLVEGCLSSPVVVLFAAVVFGWPAKWWKRLLVIFLGFIPFFYGYHLVRAVLVSLTLSFQSKEVNLVYNFYGQAFLFLFLLGFLGYYRCAVQKEMSYRKYLAQSVCACLVAFSVAFGLEWLNNHGLTPWLVKMVSDREFLAYDPEQAVSTMPAVWTFIWLVLVGSTPHLTIRKKAAFGVSGILAILIIYAAMALLFETFHLAPHKGLLKLFVIILPAVVYMVCCLRLPKSRADMEATRPKT